MRSLRCSSLHPDLGHLDRPTSRRRFSAAPLEVFDLDRLDPVGDVKTENSREEVHLALDRAPDVPFLAEPVLLALERNVCVGQLLFLANLDELLSLIWRHDLVLETLEENHRHCQVVREVDRGAIPVEVGSRWIRPDEGIEVVRLELVRLLDEALEVTDSEMAGPGVVEVALGE